jgi:hypothetical protein
MFARRVGKSDNATGLLSLKTSNPFRTRDAPPKSQRLLRRQIRHATRTALLQKGVQFWSDKETDGSGSRPASLRIIN